MCAFSQELSCRNLLVCLGKHPDGRLSSLRHSLEPAQPTRLYSVWRSLLRSCINFLRGSAAWHIAADSARSYTLDRHASLLYRCGTGTWNRFGTSGSSRP